MKLNMKVLGSTVALAILVLGFQNCSPVNFGAGDELAQKSGIAGPIDDGLADEVLDDEFDDGDGSEDVADHDASNPDHADHEEKDCPDKGPGTKDKDKTSEAEKYRNYCREDNKGNGKGNGFVDLTADANVILNNGSGNFKAPSINIIGISNGKVVAKHDGTGSGHIKEVRGNNGMMILCGCDSSSVRRECF